MFRPNSQPSHRSSNPHPTPRNPHLNLSAACHSTGHALSNAPLKRSRQAQRAFDTFGLPFIATRDPQDIRLFAVNIDSHPDLERIVVATSDLDVEAAVLRRDNDVWWELGNFVCCGPGSQPNLPFLESRQTVSLRNQ